MLTTFGNIVVLLACLLFALLSLWLLSRFWTSSQRRSHNNIIGWQITVVGTTYAVILGFMLYAVWTFYHDADINADGEANSLVNVFRLAEGLPAAQRAQVRQLVRQYADIVIDQEWPVFHRGELSLAGQDTVQKLWSAVLQTRPSTFGEQTVMNQTLSEISAMTEHRRVRQIEGEFKLPTILWMMLIVGGVITLLSSCLFGVENFGLHCAQVISLTLMLSLILIAIADIDRPFQGTIHITPRGFERARETFANTP